MAILTDDELKEALASALGKAEPAKQPPLGKRGQPASPQEYRQGGA